MIKSIHNFNSSETILRHSQNYNFVDLLKMANKTLSFYKLFIKKSNLYYMGYTVASFIDLKSISCTFAHA